MDIGIIIIQIIAGVIVTAPALWYAGKWRVGGEKAKFTDAVWITAAGVVLNSIIGAVLGTGLGSIVQLIAYLYLVKTYFDTDYVNAAIISFVSVLIMVAVGVVLGILGIAILNI